ncbi:MAG: winged helix-turn-helix domain-containing protein [Myxococcota bacterium]
MRGFRIGGRRVDLGAGTVRGEGWEHALTVTEVKLLRYLARRAGQLVPREVLLVEVWGYRPGVASRTVDNTTARLRQKLEDQPHAPRHLISVYGQGLRLEGVEVDLDPADPGFVGRAAESAALVTELSRARVVTLVGPAGAGKSRLAREVVGRLDLERIFVPCGTVRVPADLDAAVRAALGGRAPSNGPIGPALATLTEAVLVLDECELAVESIGRRVAEWLPVAPRLVVLATSRERLGIAAERVVPLGPLPVDDAVALFQARVGSETPIPADAARKLVAQVDALPLAIELAAARCGVVGHEVLSELLCEPLRVLGGPGRRSMAEVLERSFDGLPDPLRHLLTELAVFEADFGLEDLTEVTGMDATRALDPVEELLSRSLVRLDGSRYRLYTVVRERARRDLAPDAPARDRHARWFGRLGDPERIAGASRDPAHNAALGRAVADLRAAEQHARGRDVEVAERCGLALVWQTSRGGAFAEGLEAEARVSGYARTPRVQIFLALAAVKMVNAAGDAEAAIRRLEQVAPLAESPFDIVHVRCSLAIHHHMRGDRAAATKELELSGPYAPAAGDAQALWFQVAGYYNPDRAAGDEMLREGARVARRFGNRNLEINNLTFLSEMLLRQGEYVEVAALLERATELCEHPDVGPRNRAFVLYSAGSLRRFLGALDAAEELLERALEWASPDSTNDSLELELARLALQRGRHDEARTVADRLRWEKFRPNHISCEAQLLYGTVLVLQGAMAEAEVALRDAVEHAREGRFTLLECHALESLAAATLDPTALDLAEALPLNARSAVRRDAIGAWVAARRGDPTGAQLALERARAGAAALGLGPEAEFSVWLVRAEHAVAAVGRPTLTVAG